MTARVGFTAQVVPVRGGGEKIVVTDEEGMKMDLVILGPEEGRMGRTFKNVRLVFFGPWSRPKLVGLWGGQDQTVVVLEAGKSDEWHGPLRKESAEVT